MDIDLNDALRNLADDGSQQPRTGQDQTVTEQADETTAAEESAAEQPTAAEPVAEEPAAQEPTTVDQGVTDEPVIDETTTIEPAATGATSAEQVAVDDDAAVPAKPVTVPAEHAVAAGIGATAAQQAVTSTATPSNVTPITAAHRPSLVEAPEFDELPEPAADEPDRRRGLWFAGAAAALVAIGATALWPSGDKGIQAAPAPSASTSTSTTLSASPASVPTPALPQTPQTWAWTGANPASTVIPLEEAVERCAVKDTEQVVGPKGTTVFHPGMPLRVGPKSAQVPANNAVTTGWRGCTLGYQKQPLAAPIGETELSKVPAKLVKACADHSGFDFTGWTYAVSDTRLNPRTNNVSDASVALNGPGGWAVGCEMSAGSDVAALSFLAPTDQQCPRVHAAPMGKPGGPAGPAPAGAPAGPPPGGHAGEGPGGVLYWVTAFGRVPAAARAQVASGGYDVGKVSRSAAMVHTGNGLAVANHTWKPSQADPSDTSKTPTLTFFDKAGKPLASCASS